MASTSKEWVGANSWSGGRIEVSSTANVNGNYSTVTVKLYARRIDGGTSYNASGSNFWININGSQTSRMSGCTISGSSWQLVHSQSTNVSHNSDGTKTITVSGGGNITGTTFNLNSTSVSLTLDKIARKSTLAVSNGTLGESSTLTVTRQNTSFTHTIIVKSGTVSKTVCEKSGNTSISFTPSLEDFAPCNTTGTTVAITYTIETFNGSSSLGSNSTTATYAIPDSVVPSITNAIVTDSNGYKDTYDAYVQGKSKYQVDANVSGVYGSSIASVTVSADGNQYVDTSGNESYSVVTNAIQSTGTQNVSITVKDSRGRITTENVSVSILAYTRPSITALKVVRCDSSGTESSSGSYFKAVFSSIVTALNNNNTATYKLKYILSAQSEYTTQTLTGYADNYSVTDGYVIFPSSPIGDEVTCTALIELTDAFETVGKQENGGTVTKVFSILSKGLGFAFGKVATLASTLDIGWKTRHSGGLDYMIVPTGSDLNEYMIANTYLLSSNNTYTNVPISDANAILDVIGSVNGALLQRYTQLSNTGHIVYERVYTGETWTSWKKDVSDLLNNISAITTKLTDQVVYAEQATTMTCKANTVTGIYHTPTITSGYDQDDYDLVGCLFCNTAQGNVSMCTCKIQSDGQVYIAMKNWTTSGLTVHPEYYAIYMKK